MKKKLLYLLTLGMFFTGILFAQQDTIIAWTFPTGDLGDTVANAGIEGNVNKSTIRAEGGVSAIIMKNGVATSAAQATNWNDGMDTKCWSIKFKAAGYTDLRLFSTQQAGGADAGPKDWKIQWKFSKGEWADVTDGTIECANDWTTSAVENLTLPITNQGSTSIYLRWILTSNNDINGVALASTGKSKIDNIIVLGTPEVVAAGDTITGWSFSDADDVEFNSNMGLEGNQGYDIRAENETAETSRTITLTKGAHKDDFAATAEGWDAGNNDKFWSIKLKANGYKDFKVSSKQRSGGTNAGPKNWKIQAQLSKQEWIDIPDGKITVANDWTTGVANGLAFPSDFDNPGTTSIYIRWIMTSNDDINGGTVEATGTSKIDDILITATATETGITTELFSSKVNVYPNPCNGILNIASTEDVDKVEIYNIQGRKVEEVQNHVGALSINTESLSKGLYFVRIFFHNERIPMTKKVIVE
ncbi:MAG: T9SS type A sorting domain-containing protein [Bacteroidetes bacterium]|nr:T9SS type A sorting domain-containing protein [Bacteroidota bacterium]